MSDIFSNSHSFRGSLRALHQPALISLSLALAIASASTAHAQWTVTNLSPAGSTFSQATSVNGGQQAGYSRDASGLFHAGMWSGTAASWIDLNPPGATQSSVYAMSGAQQAGYARVDGFYHAGFWTGSAASWVDLNPPDAFESYVYAINGGQQAGYIRLGSEIRASLWSGTSASWVDLRPAGSTESRAYAVGGGQQAGYAYVSGGYHAGMWSGTAASWVDFNPFGSSQSYVFAISGGQQVGYAVFLGARHAGLWNGSAASWIDLNPPGATQSEARAINGGLQVGNARIDGVDHAGLWTGTAASWYDLSAFLPAEFASSFAGGISSDATSIYIVGYGWNTLTERSEALLWTGPLCPPPTITYHPESQRLCSGGASDFYVTASSVSPATCQWQWKPQDQLDFQNVIDGVNIDPGTGEPLFNAVGIGATGVEVRPVNVATSFHCEFRAIITNACDSVSSNAALWTICPADFNCDSSVDFFDYLDFVDAFSSMSAAADFNRDGAIDFFDYLDFVDAFSIGC